MLILTIRTDNPEAELGLYNDAIKLSYESWPAHRQLAETIHHRITAILEQHAKHLQDVQAIVCYQGPGSFTGLRIGASVANAMAEALGAPIVARSGTDWIETGISDILSGANDQLALPDYGAEPKTTLPRK